MEGDSSAMSKSTMVAAQSGRWEICSQSYNSLRKCKRIPLVHKKRKQSFIKTVIFLVLANRTFKTEIQKIDFVFSCNT